MEAINGVSDGTSSKPTETPRKHFSKAEKDKIMNSLFGVLPSTVDLDETREERLR